MRKPWVIGLIAGAIGGAVNIVVTTLMGICGPLWSLAVGAIAGYLAGRFAGAVSKRTAIEAGATAGGVAGLLLALGQIVGAVGAILIMSTLSPGAPVFGGTVPDLANATPAELIGVAIGGLGFGLCFGLLGAMLSAAAGAGMAYLARALMPEAQSV
jgi:hypothetical protein